MEMNEQHLRGCAEARMPDYIGSVLPIEQFAENASQYVSDFNEAQRRWNEEELKYLQMKQEESKQ